MIKNKKEGYCSEEISTPGIWAWHQCNRKAKNDGFCTIHHPDYVKAKNAERDKRWDDKMWNSHRSKLYRAEKKLKIAMDVLKTLKLDLVIKEIKEIDKRP